jgi:hypothetical protein
MKNEENIAPTVGPGQYDPEKADPHTKPLSRAYDFSHSGRKDIVNDPNTGPGSYDPHINFGEDARGGLIGDKREFRT